MAIVATDILFKLSRTAGSAGDAGSSTPAASLGKYISTTAIDLGTPLNNLFDDISGDEAAAGRVEYRCFFVHNNHATLALLVPVRAWISADAAGGAAWAIGLDPAGVTAKGSASAQAAEIADETTAPSGVSFSAPTDKAGGLVIASIPAQSVVAIWVRRTITAGTAAVDADSVTLRVEGDTAA